jgi:hypothetical protein
MEGPRSDPVSAGAAAAVVNAATGVPAQQANAAATSAPELDAAPSVSVRDDRSPLPPLPPASPTGRIRTALLVLLLVLLVFLNSVTDEEAASFTGHLHNRGVGAGGAAPPFLPDSPKMPCLFIFVGESFRTGGQKSRVRGLNSSLPAQRAAVESHLSLHRRLAQEDGHVCDVIVRSYTTPFDADLCSWYREGIAPAGGRVVDCYFDTGAPMGLHMLLAGGLASLPTGKREGGDLAEDVPADAGEGRRPLHEYAFTIISRIDIFYKPLLLTLVNPFASTLQFSFNMWIKGARTNEGFPRVGNMFTFVPRDLYRVLSSTFPFDHDAWHMFVTDSARYTMANEDMGLIASTLHDADSAKDWNPLYYVVNRNMCCEWSSPGWEVVDTAMPPVQTETYPNFSAYHPLVSMSDPCLHQEKPPPGAVFECTRVFRRQLEEVSPRMEDLRKEEKEGVEEGTATFISFRKGMQCTA